LLFSYSFLQYNNYLKNDYIKMNEKINVLMAMKGEGK